MEENSLTENKKSKTYISFGKESYSVNNFEILSEHAKQRIFDRGIKIDFVFRTIGVGRISRGRGATIYSIGKKEIKKYSIQKINLQPCEGIHVVTNRSGLVLTVYKNLAMPKLKPRKKLSEKVFKENRRH